MTLQNSSNKLDLLIENDISFAIYRLPNESSLKFVMQTQGEPKQLYDIEELDLSSGFVIAPYRISEKSPILVIRPDCTDINEAVIPHKHFKNKSSEKTDKEKIRNINRSEYNKLFEIFYHPLNEGVLKKLVLTRSKTIRRNKSFSTGKSFYKAMEKYRDSFVYLCHTPRRAAV